MTRIAPRDRSIALVALLTGVLVFMALVGLDEAGVYPHSPLRAGLVALAANVVARWLVTRRHR